MTLTYDFREGIAIRTWRSACNGYTAMPENAAAGGARSGIEAGVDEVCDIWSIGM